MKSLILFSSKNPEVVKVCKKIATKIKHFDMIDVTESISDITSYDRVYIGFSIHQNRIDRSLKEFIHKHKEELITCDIRLFSIGMDEVLINKVMHKDISRDIVLYGNHIHLGGFYKPAKETILKRLFRKDANQIEQEDTFDATKINDLIKK